MWKPFGSSREEPVYLIVGLGNPESRYDRTRHNVGFRALDRLAKRLDVKVNRFKWKAIYGQGRMGEHKVILMKPQTYMNLSGESVREAAGFWKVPAERIIVLFDDISLPVGKIRVRPKGSAGGHNGIKSIISCLGTDAFPRVKVGVGGKPHPEMDLADWVLSAFSSSEEKELEPALERAAEAAELLVTRGAEPAMNRFNG